MRKIGFVVLHYLAYDMTCSCIETLLSTFSRDYISQIVVVDNFSPNGSGKLLQQKYQGNEVVVILQTESNLGFAKGNNFGYEFLKGKGESDFIVIMNNDVLITDKDFAQKIFSCYEETGFDILGPDIYNPKTYLHQSPVRKVGLSKQEVESTIISLQKRFKHLKYYSLRHTLFGWLRTSIRKVRKQNGVISKEILENVVLHGACYIISNSFIDKMDYVFYPKTFLYFEEDILHLLCIQNGFKMIYNPNIQVNHLEDISTNLEYNNYYKKEKMKIPTVINSMSVFLDLLDRKKLENLDE